MYHFQVQAIYTDQLVAILARIHTPVRILIYQRQTYLYLCLCLHAHEIRKDVKTTLCFKSSQETQS